MSPNTIQTSHTKIDDSNANEYCRTCRRINFHSPPSTAKTHYLGTLPEIFLRQSTCALCHPITHIYQPLWHARNLSALDKHAFHAGVELGVTFFTPSGTVRRLEPQILTFLPDEGAAREEDPEEEVEVWSEYVPVIVEERVPEGGRRTYPVMGRVRGEFVDLERLRGWLEECEVKHEEVGEEGLEGKVEKLLGGFRVMDVLEGRLRVLPEGCRFVTLSYVWGRTPFLMLSRENQKELEKPGGLFGREDMACVVDCAMKLLQELGEKFRYLWVDALCIQQDKDSPEKAILIPQMDVIYSKSYATVVALDGVEAATSGLPGVKGFPRAITQTSENLGRFRMATRCDKLEPAMAKSVWNERAWCYQEKLLSNRRIYLSETQIYFECNHGFYREEAYDRSQRVDKDKDLSRQLDSIVEIAHNDGKGTRGLLELFNNLLADYIERKLSYANDLLNAMAGIVAKWEAAINKRFTNGLPYLLPDSLGLSLLWMPKTVVKRRVFQQGERAYSPFPSWSWCGWEGGVKYCDFYLTDAAHNELRPDYHSMSILSRDNFELHENEAHDKKLVRALTADILCFTAHSAKFRVSATDAVVTRIRFHNEEIVHMCIYDEENVQCGIATGFDPGMLSSARDSCYECVRLLSGGTWSSRFEVEKLKFENPEMDLMKAYASGMDDSDIEEDHNGHYDTEVYRDGLDGLNRLVHVLIIERHGELAERVAIGMIHEEAFKKARSTEKEFKIA